MYGESYSFLRISGWTVFHFSNHKKCNVSCAQVSINFQSSTSIAIEKLKLSKHLGNTGIKPTLASIISKFKGHSISK
jgi:hypothetical protein